VSGRGSVNAENDSDTGFDDLADRPVLIQPESGRVSWRGRRQVRAARDVFFFEMKAGARKQTKHKPGRNETRC